MSCVWFWWKSSTQNSQIHKLVSQNCCNLLFHSRGSSKRHIYNGYILELPVQILHAQCTQKNDGREGVWWWLTVTVPVSRIITAFLSNPPSSTPPPHPMFRSSLIIRHSRISSFSRYDELHEGWKWWYIDKCHRFDRRKIHPFLMTNPLNS